MEVHSRSFAPVTRIVAGTCTAAAKRIASARRIGPAAPEPHKVHIAMDLGPCVAQELEASSEMGCTIAARSEPETN